MNVVVSHWSANVAVLVAYAVAAAAHLLGMRGGVATGGRRQDWSRPAGVAAYHAGLLLALLVVVSPVGYWSQRFIWVRSVQDVVLAFGAPALIVLGAPWEPLARGLGLGGRLHGRKQQARPEGSTAAGLVPPRAWRTLPVVVTVAFSISWWGWHVPGLYDAALRHPVLYAAEIVTYMGAGVLLWLQLAGSQPYRPWFGPLQRLVLAVGTAVSCAILGIVGVFGTGLLYTAYLGIQHHVLSVVADQQVGGAVLSVIPLVPFGILVIALLIGWLNDEESESMAAGFDRLLKPPQSAWPSRPRLR